MFYICNTLLPILVRSTSVRQLLCRIWCHGIQKIRISCGFWWLLICTCFRELVIYIWSQLGMVGWFVGNAHDPSWRSDRRKNLKSIQMKTSHILPPPLSPLYKNDIEKTGNPTGGKNLKAECKLCTLPHTKNTHKSSWISVLCFLIIEACLPAVWLLGSVWLPTSCRVLPHHLSESCIKKCAYRF